MKVVFIVIAVAMLTPNLSFADVPEYVVKRTTDKIVIDGVLDEDDWQKAASVGEFKFPWSHVAGDRDQTEVKMLWDDIFLYLSYRCDDRYIWVTHHDSNSQTFRDDCVEFFWNPNPGVQKKYNMFEVNATGNMLSVYTGSGKSLKERISRILPPHIAQTVEGTVNYDADIDTGWTLEIAIRFSDYPELSPKSAPEPGDMWRVGLNRCSGRGGQTSMMWSMWSPPKLEKPRFHVPDDFGKIIFSSDAVR
ncbi:carbohydrate-binding family 9-like protein [Candidatus Latescibacterota bacterium]